MSIFDAAEAQNTATQREALAALATGGSKARDAYLAAQQAQKADKAAVMRDIMDRSTQIAAPEAGVLHQAQAAPRMDLRATALAGSATSNQNLLGTLAAANKNYFDQVAAAIPIVKQRALIERDERAAKAQQEMTPGKIISALGGQTVAGKALEEAVGRQRGDFHERARDVLTFGLARRKDSTIANEIAEEAGLPTGYGAALLPKKPAAKKPSQGAYRTDVTRRVQQHASPPTAKAFNDIVAVSKNLPDALATLDASSDEELEEDYGTLDRAALARWIADYYRYG